MLILKIIIGSYSSPANRGRLEQYTEEGGKILSELKQRHEKERFAIVDVLSQNKYILIPPASAPASFKRSTKLYVISRAMNGVAKKQLYSAHTSIYRSMWLLRSPYDCNMNLQIIF